MGWLLLALVRPKVGGVFVVAGVLPNSPIPGAVAALEAGAPPNKLEVGFAVLVDREPKLLGLVLAPNELLLVAPKGLGPEVAPLRLNKPAVVLGGSAMMKARCLV